MTAEENKQTVLRAYAAASAGEVATFVDVLDDEIEYTVLGTHAHGKTYRGKNNVLTNLIGPTIERVEAGIKFHFVNAIAEGDQVVVEYQGEARTKDGRPYNNHYCMVFKLKAGKITRVREYLDTDLLKSILD